MGQEVVGTLGYMFRRLRYALEMRMSRRSTPSVPDGRTWIHPSELPGPFDQAVLPPPHPTVARRFQVAVAGVASALLATGGVLLAASATVPAGATVGPHVAASVAALPRADRAAARALVALEIYEGQHLGTATAMVLPPGDLAVTTAPVPPGATVDGWCGGHGWMTLSVVGADRGLGITVLHLPTTVPITPVAPLANALATTGSPTSLTALAAIPGATVPVEFEYAAAFLDAAESPVTIGRTVLATASGESTAGVISGSVVLAPSGAAVAVPVPVLGPSSFVSATFLSLLAERLVLGDAAAHGWLQLAGADTLRGTAVVLTVAPHGASWGHLRAGDQILAVNSMHVATMADVDTILYTLSPRTPVTLTIDRGGRTLAVTVRLAASP
ncbi:MAG TPA: PDZ domain-containing protein [Acidimicrobiales bacterium]|nr:PDZ domain-containing protein [Acidimicrobiales bacterium]